MEEKSEKKLKGISKALSIVSKVIKVFVIIGVVGCVLAALIMPFVFKQISFENDTLKVGNDSVLNIKAEDNKISILVDEKVIAIDNMTMEEYENLKEILAPESKQLFLTYIEASLFIAILTLCILCVIMNYTDKLFRNIYNEKSPFTLDNIDYIRKIAYLTITYIVIPLILGGLFELITGKGMTNNVTFLEVFLIIVIFAISYVFEYGYSIENKNIKQIKEK